jgi:membrane-associated protein
MIEWIKNFIQSHPEYAPIAIMISIAVAGFNIPISADMMILVAATLAATLLKGAFFKLYLAILCGTILAAYATYAQGRFIGPKILKIPFMHKLFPAARLQKVEYYFKRYSWLTFIIGRFIPFGFRNCLFLSAGLTKIPFKSFALKDGIAAIVWSLTVFTSLYKLITKVDDLSYLIKKFNLIIFIILGLSIIAAVWYKQIKRRKATI